jgi:hypothetical protein
MTSHRERAGELGRTGHRADVVTRTAGIVGALNSPRRAPGQARARLSMLGRRAAGHPVSGNRRRGRSLPALFLVELVRRLTTNSAAIARAAEFACVLLVEHGGW